MIVAGFCVFLWKLTNGEGEPFLSKTMVIDLVMLSRGGVAFNSALTDEYGS